MCRQNVVAFIQCGHSAQTMNICGFNGVFPPRPCSSGWDGVWDQRKALCRGCHEVLQLRCFNLDQAMSAINSLPTKMPFSYVVYGHLPFSRAEGIERARTEHMFVRIMGFGMDPLEEMLSKLKMGDAQGAYFWGKSSLQEKTSGAKRSSPTSTFEQDALSQRHRSFLSLMTPVDSCEGPINRARRVKSALSHLAKRPPSFLKSRAPSQSPHRPNSTSQSKEKPPSTSPLDPAFSSERNIAHRNPVKGVRFAGNVEVQYFKKDMATKFVEKQLW